MSTGNSAEQKRQAIYKLILQKTEAKQPMRYSELVETLQMSLATLKAHVNVLVWRGAIFRVTRSGGFTHLFATMDNPAQKEMIHQERLAEIKTRIAGQEDEQSPDLMMASELAHH
jgi:predicted transcriptional regulator